MRPTVASNGTSSKVPSFSDTPVYHGDFSDTRIFEPNGDFKFLGEEALRLKLQVLQLIADHFPGVETEREPTIQKIGEGSYNFVIGVSLNPPTSHQDSVVGIGSTFSKLSKLFSRQPPRSFALRLPLDIDGLLEGPGFGDIARDVTTLQVVSSHISVPVPKIIKYDLGIENALGRQYTLQTRLEGESLSFLWHAMTMPQKLSIMQEITKMTEKIARCTSPVAGYISERNRDCYSSIIHLDQFTVPTEAEAERRPQFPQPTIQPAPKQTPHEFLIDQCKRWIAYEATFGHDHHSRSLWQQLISLIDWLQEHGWLGDRFHLVHGDLFPRNILAKITSPTTVEITGIVDWDLACFAPKFVALRAPFWGWAHTERDEDGAFFDPHQAEDKLLKKAFRAAASKEYVNLGLSVESVVARKLFDILTYGLMGHGQRDLAIELLQQWHMLHPNDGVRNLDLY